MDDQMQLDYAAASFDGWTALDLLNTFFSESLVPLTSSKARAELLLRGVAEPLADQQQALVEQIRIDIDRVVALRQALLDECKKRVENE